MARNVIVSGNMVTRSRDTGILRLRRRPPLLDLRQHGIAGVYVTVARIYATISVGGTISGNTVFGTGTGITAYGGQQITIINNTVHDNGTGIAAYGNGQVSGNIARTTTRRASTPPTAACR